LRLVRVNICAVDRDRDPLRELLECVTVERSARRAVPARRDEQRTHFTVAGNQGQMDIGSRRFIEQRSARDDRPAHRARTDRDAKPIGVGGHQRISDVRKRAREIVGRSERFARRCKETERGGKRMLGWPHDGYYW
jgi:hypothetical protein